MNKEEEVRVVEHNGKNGIYYEYRYNKDRFNNKQLSTIIKNNKKEFIFINDYGADVTKSCLVQIALSNFVLNSYLVDKLCKCFSKDQLYAIIEDNNNE